ncbi:MAG: spore coat protein CotJB [Christensenellales bacterium]|jgi:spore coat protein JB
MTRSELIKQIYELEFVCIDLNLYLDTHPDCEPALVDYNCYVRQLKALKEQYQRQFGPLMNFGGGAGNLPFDWPGEAWPWQRQA